MTTCWAGLKEMAWGTKPSWLASMTSQRPEETKCARTPWWNLRCSTSWQILYEEKDILLNQWFVYVVGVKNPNILQCLQNKMFVELWEKEKLRYTNYILASPDGEVSLFFKWTFFIWSIQYLKSLKMVSKKMIVKFLTEKLNSTVCIMYLNPGYGSGCSVPRQAQTEDLDQHIHVGHQDHWWKIRREFLHFHTYNMRLGKLLLVPNWGNVHYWGSKAAHSEMLQVK